MSYEFLDKLKREADSIIYMNEDICFNNGYSLSIQAGSCYNSTPREDFEDNRKYSCFEVAVKYNCRIIDEYDDSFINVLYEIYGSDGIFFDMPAEYVDKVYWFAANK